MIEKGKPIMREHAVRDTEEIERRLKAGEEELRRLYSELYPGQRRAV